jgi:DNA-binding transcriptional ArsR family regulator
MFGTMSATTLDACLKLISDRQRRKIIHHLRDETAGETRVEGLVDHLHDSEAGGVAEARPDQNQLSIQLIHNHLPKLDDHGIIHYDQENKIVQYQPDEQIELVLDTLPSEAAQVSLDS